MADSSTMLQGFSLSRYWKRGLALILLIAMGLLLSAGEEEWLAQRAAMCITDSPSSSFLLAKGCPAKDISGYFSLSYTKPGIILDTVGINAAPAGSWNLTIDGNGQLAFSIYSPNQRNSFDVGNGWHRYALPQPLQAGSDYNLAFEVNAGHLLLALFVGDDEAGALYEELPCALANSPVYVGDYPDDDSWGASYNIHPSFIGDLLVLYFGPQIDDLTPEAVVRTWVNPSLQLGTLGLAPSKGQELVTTDEDARDWNGAPATGEAGGGMFTLDYSLNSGNQSHYNQTDCIEALLTASPFYSGAASGPGVQTGELDRLRQVKVAEIVTLAADLRKVVAQVEPELRKLEAAYAQMIKVGLSRDASYEAYVQCTLQELATMKAQVETAMEQAGKLAKTSGDPLADANMQYVSVVHTVKLGGLCLKQADSICLFAALPQGEFAQSGDTQLKQAAAQMEQALAGYDALAPKLEQVAVLLSQIDCGLQQLEAADYYVGLAGLDFMGAQLPELERQLTGAAARPGVTVEQIAQARETLRYNKLMYEVLSEQMARAPMPKLIAQAPEKPRPCGAPGLLLEAACVLGPQPAYAVEEQQLPTLKDLASSMKNIREVADLPRDPDNPTFGESMKKVYRQFNSDVNRILDFKNARNQLGNAVDGVNAYVHKVAREGYGWYYGNSAEEIEKDVEDNYQQLAKNQEDGRQGSETYRTAKSYMEGAENLADAAAKDFIEKSFGGTLAPWAAGKIAKGLTSVFTGLAKGIYAVLDPTSTEGEVAVGIAEIALASTAGNAKAYEASLTGFQQMLKSALGLGSVKECLNVVLDQYKEDLGKELLGTGLDGKSLVNSFLNFIGVTPEMLEEFSYDGHYLGTISGAAGGTIAFTVQGTTWQGSVSGSYSWQVEGMDISGTSEYNGSIYGSFDPATGALSGEVSGTTNGERFSGPISGSLIRDVGGAVVGRGTWQGSDSDDTLSGSWSVTRQ